ncbi:threonine--tRNA ligase [Oceanirhabdus sp. W0125-5]|uniref:threonine--tRNA ligase n=1 Tax=Oceanirhabdus sp. W0125-5 TaxID=2999116 RepID=UPI0022F319E6|nr:threonine--tRNA ligase [Oceanirhabdus sp. W0125-5]WBW99705.1 threonine--tRNA ligase [Oceanirhabdus sp. W0125-5]
MIKVKLNNGAVKEIERGGNLTTLAKSISGRLYKEAVAGEVNGKVVGLTTELHDNDEVNILKFEDEKGADVYRHTAAHIMAYAIKRLYKDVKLAIGPSIENGFYYDFDLSHKLSENDFNKIEEEMKKIIKEEHPIEKFELERGKAIKLMEEKGEKYKVELINDLPEEAIISFYKMGDFVDLCAGPHLPNTKMVKSIKLMSIAGAYWKGDEKREMLTRIYATAFPKQSMLQDYLEFLEEAKRRDHRKLGKELKLFAIMEEGPGFPFMLPMGMILKNKIIDFWKDIHSKSGYVEVETPIILNRHLWETSGHWDHYRENMYALKIDDEDYAIKPMSCPGGMLVYKSEVHSYRDFPIRMAELGRVHRHELSGALHGLMRVRSFVQDDAHIFMLPEQIKDEIIGVIRLIEEIYSAFGFQYNIKLSTRPEDSIGSIEDWDMAECALKEALDQIGKEYVINEGDGAFYGPKIDFDLKDSLGRTWQCGTIQLDFQLPQRFDLNYIGKDGEKHRPIVIHRAIYGSIERFMGILIEHFEGKFPVWISPVQVKVLPISEKYKEYCDSVVSKLKENGIRVEIDNRAEKIGYKIREARNERVPYIIIAGEKESEEGVVSLRSRENGEEGSVSINKFIDRIIQEIEEKK